MNSDIFHSQATNTGCNGPYVYGDNASSGCPCWGCKCCPPPCCSSVVIHFDCVSQCNYLTSENGTPLIDESGICVFILSESSVASKTYSVNITATPGILGGICCIEFVGGGSSFRAVGNGTIKISVSGSAGSICGSLTGLIDGVAGPVTVNDGDTFTVTVESEHPVCCPCSKTIATNPCGLSMRMATLTKGNKIVLNRRMLLQRMAQRILK